MSTIKAYTDTDTVEAYLALQIQTGLDFFYRVNERAPKGRYIFLTNYGMEMIKQNNQARYVPFYIDGIRIIMCRKGYLP